MVEVPAAEAARPIRDEIDQLEPLLASLDRLERLRCFGLANFAGSWAELIPKLATHRFWPRLETLDLSRGALGLVLEGTPVASVSARFRFVVTQE